MFHGYRKVIAVFATIMLLLLAACSAPTGAISGAKLSNALVNAQSTSTPGASSILSLTVQPYPTPFTEYEVGSTMSHVLATGTDELGPGDPITATIDWGDKTAPTQYTFIDGRTFQVTGAHAYSKVGKYTITVTVAITAFQQSTSGTGVITVVPDYTLSVNTIRPTSGRPFHGVIATGTDPIANDPLSGTIDWGDNTTPTSVHVVSSAQGSFQLNATHTYSQVVGSTITVSLTSGIVGPIQGTGTAAAFILHANTITARAGHLFSGRMAMVTGTISSGGLLVDTEWGDGLKVGKQTLGGGTGTWPIRGSHVYAQAGTYTFTISVKDLGTGEQTFVKGTVIVE